jgi:hypothetical protein
MASIAGFLYVNKIAPAVFAKQYCLRYLKVRPPKLGAMFGGRSATGRNPGPLQPVVSS